MKNTKVIYQVDAFTDQAFKGNPAGVMILESEMTVEKMQDIASEMNLSETAFIIERGAVYEIRYFTPTNEVPLCGHATLASAHVLYELGIKKENETIVFEAAGGVLNVNKDADGIQMLFPKYPIEKIAVHKDFKSIIGFEPVVCYSSTYDWIIAMAATEDDITKAKPNFEKMKEQGLGQLMITAKSEQQDIDYVVRCFAPNAGINEDPVTGSAQCGLVPFWNIMTDQTDFNVVQVSKRTGVLKVKLKGQDVEIKGKAITIFKADFMI